MPRAPKIQISGPAEGMPNYTHAVRHAGGVPVPGYCPPPDPGCDGLLLCGGGDLDPALFGWKQQGSHPPDRERDLAELHLIAAFLAARRPILGVCRGMQVLNCALGGGLIQHLPDAVRPFHQDCGGDLYHPVLALEGSLLFRLYGPRFVVNSAHHQAVAQVAPGLTASAWAEGGFPEGLEHTTLPVVGVQFHPERLAWAHSKPGTIDGALLFDWFLARCRGCTAACGQPGPGCG